MQPRLVSALWFCTVFLVASAVDAQDSPESAPPVESPAAPGSPETEVPPAADAGVAEADASAPDAAAPEAAPIAEPTQPEPPTRGDTPVALETVVDPDVVPEAEPKPPEAAEPTEEAPAQPAKPAQPSKPPRLEPTPAPARPAAPERLIAWAIANWAASLGPARCGDRGLEGAESAIRIASTLKRSVAAAGLAIAPAGLIGDHPVIAHAARDQPEQLATLLAEIGVSVLAVGVADVNGPLFREPQLSAALRRRGVTVLATNLECGGEAWCDSWMTAEDPVSVLERDGRRYAVFSVLPDDLLGRVEPAAGRTIRLRVASDTLVSRTEEARLAGADLIVASVDHGRDASASVNLASFLSDLPPDVRPDLLLSPSAGENLLFLRPLDVHPAVVGTRPGVLTGLRVTKLLETRDADVFARSVRVNDWDEGVAAGVSRLGASYCEAHGKPLRGGQLDAPMMAEELVLLGADAARERADADLAVVDPYAYDPTFSAPAGVRLQRGQAERMVVLDSPLVAANVTLEWLAGLEGALNGLRPLALIGKLADGGEALIAGRIPIPGARYRIVTTAVLARSKRLPDGASWTPLRGAAATLRGALLDHLDEVSVTDPRARVRDPMESTQWVFRGDAQLLANLTAVDAPEGSYPDEPALQVNESRQLGARVVLNLDADAPEYLFENAAQVAFDRNFATRTTAQDLLFLQTTYTYRGLWPRPLLYPHPFVEAYVETQFDQGQLDYHHLLVRPEAGFRSMVSRLLSLKLSAGFQYEVLEPDSEVDFGAGAEVLLKPWTVGLSNGTFQLEGNITYYWNAPGTLDEHTLRGQLITAVTLIGPLQFTLSTLGVLRKDPSTSFGKGFSVQAGVRLRFIERTMND